MMRLLLATVLASMLGPPGTRVQDAPERKREPAAEAERRLELRIRPGHATAPAAIRATAFVSRRTENRALTLGVECPIYLRRSTIQLDGADAARSHTIIFESLPACSYEVSATLHRQDGPDIVEILVAEVSR